MRNFMRTSIVILLLMFSVNAFTQEAFKKVTLSKVGWTLLLPTEFKILDSTENEELHSKGHKALKETVGVKTDMKRTKTLINAMKDRFSLFNSTIRPLNAEQIRNYGKSAQRVKDLTFEAMKAKSANNQVDSISSSQIIDGLNFNKFTVTVSMPKNLTVTMVILSKVHKGFDFGITYVYTNDITKGQIEEILNSSKFK